MLRLNIHIILVLFLFITKYSFAYMPNSKISCPPVNIIQQASHAIDKAIKFDESYIVISTSPVFRENKKQWRIEVQLNARSKKEAVDLARKAVKEISYLDGFRDLGNDDYYCDYGPIKYGIVGAATI